MARILLVDDHPIVRVGLKRLLELESDFEEIGEAGTWAEARQKSDTRAWDLIVLDMFLPDIDGLEALQVLKGQHPHRPVLILTLQLETHLAVRALKLGAAGYISKASAPTALVDAVRRAAGGRMVVGDWLAEQLAIRVALPTDEPLHAQLSNRELQVMIHLAEGHPLKVIANELSLSVKTISTYRSRVLQKLGLESNAEIAVYASKHQLVR